MSLMPSLCAALERVGGERLVMRAGERPHVLAGDRRHDVASAILSVNAVEALAEQILSSDGRRELREKGTAAETIQAASFPHPLMAKAERVGDEFSIELIVQKPAAAPAPSEPEPVAIDVAPVEPVSNQSPNQNRSRLHQPPPPVDRTSLLLRARAGARRGSTANRAKRARFASAGDRRDTSRGASSSAAYDADSVVAGVHRATGSSGMDRARDRSRRDDALSSRRCAGLRTYRRSHRAAQRRYRRRVGARRSIWPRSRAVAMASGSRAQTANGFATTTTLETSAAGCSPTIMASDSSCRCGRMHRRDCCTSTFRDRCGPHVKVRGSSSCRRQPKPPSSRSRWRSPTGAAAIAGAI